MYIRSGCEMMKNYIFFVEGVHDASCIGKILKLNNETLMTKVTRFLDIV